MANSKVILFLLNQFPQRHSSQEVRNNQPSSSQSSAHRTRPSPNTSHLLPQSFLHTTSFSSLPVNQHERLLISKMCGTAGGPICLFLSYIKVTENPSLHKSQKSTMFLRIGSLKSKYKKKRPTIKSVALIMKT